MTNIRVLLVDDHMVVRIGLRALIDSEPDMVVVGEAANGVAAIAQATALLPDVIVMDISMPEMDGLEATRRIRATLPACHILILTVHAQERYLFPVLKAGGAGMYSNLPWIRNCSTPSVQSPVAAPFFTRRPPNSCSKIT